MEKYGFTLELPINNEENEPLVISGAQIAVLSELAENPCTEVPKSEIVKNTNYSPDFVTRTVSWYIKHDIMDYYKKSPPTYQLTEIGRTAIKTIDFSATEIQEIKRQNKEKNVFFVDHTSFKVIDYIYDISDGEQDEDGLIWLEEKDNDGSVIESLALEFDITPATLGKRIRELKQRALLKVKHKSQTKKKYPSITNLAITQKGQDFRRSIIEKTIDKEKLNSQSDIDDVLELQEALIHAQAQMDGLFDVTGLVMMSQLELKRYKLKLEKQYNSARLDYITQAKAA